MIRLKLSSLLIASLGCAAFAAAANPPPTHADVSYGTHPHQLMDIHIPPRGKAPFPVLLWFGGLWKESKHAPDVSHFFPQGAAVVAVETRTMTDATHDKFSPPVAYVQSDAVRAVQFVRANAAKWNLNPDRIAVGGGSQGAQPALYAGTSGDHANPASADPVERVSSKVTCVAAYRCQPTFDPKRMQEWVPGVQWGAPAFGCSFEDSLKRREELLPLIQKWSPDWLLSQDDAPMYFENEWGMTRPKDITQANYDTHSPAWAVGFQKLALAAGATCHVKYPDHPTEKYQDIWNFIVQELRAP